MKRHHGLALAFLMLVVGAAGSGCDQASNTEGRTSPSPATPKEQLLAAVPDGSQGAFKFVFGDPTMKTSGVVDPANKKVQAVAVYKDKELGFTMTMTFLVIDTESWIKVAFADTENVTGLPKLPKQWMHVDKSKIKDLEDSGLTFGGVDPVGAAALFESTGDVRLVGTGKYQGTADLTQAQGFELVDQDTVAAVGDQAKALPFQAAIDESGRLTSLSVDVPKSGETPAGKYYVTYTDYGSAPPVDQPPADQVVAAPPEAYEILNG